MAPSFTAKCPYVTFQLHCTKKSDRGENFIRWKCPINETYMANGKWSLRIKAINFANMQNNNIGTESNSFQVSANLVMQDFNWYSRMRRFVSDSIYPEQHPVMYGKFEGLASAKPSEMCIFNNDEDIHEINNLTDHLEIVLEPVKHENNGGNIKSLACDASVLVSIYNHWNF